MNENLPIAASEPCPKCGYLRQPADAGAAGECPHCGVIYAKYLEHQIRFALTTTIADDGEPAAAPASVYEAESRWARIHAAV